MVAETVAARISTLNATVKGVLHCPVRWILALKIKDKQIVSKTSMETLLSAAVVLVVIWQGVKKGTEGVVSAWAK